MKYLPNRLTPLYSKIYYKEENYLKVKTAVFKYITPPIVKVEYVGILVYQYIPIFPRSELSSCVTYVTRLPSSYGFTSSISSVSRALILTQYMSLFSTCTILFIRSVIFIINKIIVIIASTYLKKYKKDINLEI